MTNNNATQKFSEQSTPATSLKLSSSTPVAFIKECLEFFKHSQYQCFSLTAAND